MDQHLDEVDDARVEELLQKLEFGDSDERELAAAALADFSHSKVTNRLVAALSDSDPDVALRAAKSIIAIGGKKLLIDIMKKLLL